MECTLQLEYSGDAVIYFGTKSLTVRDYINELLEQYKGSIVGQHYNRGVTIFLLFPKFINAQCFFYDFKMKMTPRIFAQTKNGRDQFDQFTDEKLKEVAYSDFYEEMYQVYSINHPDKYILMSKLEEKCEEIEKLKERISRLENETLAVKRKKC